MSNNVGIIMQKYPKISIVTPSYNQDKYIEDAIRSVLNQNYPNFEHIIIDNCSNDNTLKILEKYNHLKWISEPDKGIYDAMNKGILLSNGDIIGILNTDDWYEKNIFMKIADVFNSKPDIGVVHGDMLKWKDGKVYRKDRYKSYQRYYGMWVKHPTCFVRKDIYNKYGMFNIKYKMQADYELMLRFKRNGVKFYYIPSILTNFRMGGFSTSYWNLKESIEVRTSNGFPWLWAFISAITVRFIFKSRLILKNLFK